MNRHVVTAALPDFDGREIAISDIHGNLDLYDRLLKKTDYRPGTDRLILAGDLVEKGSQNLALLHRIMEQKQDGERIFPLMGNCDFTAKNILYSYRLDFIKKVLLSRRASLIHEMAAAAGIEPLNGDSDMSEYCAAIRQSYLKELCFLNDLPHVLVSDARIYTHAGIVSETHFGDDFRETMTYPFFMETAQRFSRPVICGHLPVTEYCRTVADFNVRFDPQRNIYDIDGGNMVKKAGQLNALVFEDRYTTTCSVDSLPAAVARVSTSPCNPAPLFLTWNRGQIEMLEPGVHQSYVHSPYLNRSFWIENEFLSSSRNHLNGFDYTSYEMPLKQGESCKVVRVYQEKVQIKKNGILGWTWKKNLELPSGIKP